jgi:hypothetical protein
MDELDGRRASFKSGFLRKLAELGHTPSEFYQHIKQSFMDPTELVSSAIGGASEVGKAAVGGGLAAAGAGAKTLGYGAVLAPLAVGGVAGAAEGWLNAPSTEDIEILRKQELIGLYKRLAQEVSERKSRRVQM